MAALIAEEDFPIKASMEFHEKKKHVISVGLWRFVPK
jgi:predicted RNA methylase